MSDTIELIEAIEGGIGDLEMLMVAFAQECETLGNIARHLAESVPRGQDVATSEH